MPKATQQLSGRASILTQVATQNLPRLPHCLHSGHTPPWTALPRLSPAGDAFLSTTDWFLPPQSSQTTDSDVTSSEKPSWAPPLGAGGAHLEAGATSQACLWPAGSPLSHQGNNLGSHL